MRRSLPYPSLFTRHTTRWVAQFGMVTESRRVWESECPGSWRKCLHPPTDLFSATNGWDRTGHGRQGPEENTASTEGSLRGFLMLSREAVPGSNFRSKLRREQRTLRTESIRSLFLIGTNPEELVLKFGDGDIQLQSERGRVGEAAPRLRQISFVGSPAASLHPYPGFLVSRTPGLSKHTEVGGESRSAPSSRVSSEA